MSAYCFPVYNAYCAECADGDGPHDYADDAAVWADEHNAEFHNEPDRTDADHDHYKESLRDQQ